MNNELRDNIKTPGKNLVTLLVSKSPKKPEREEIFLNLYLTQICIETKLAIITHCKNTNGSFFFNFRQ